MDVRTAGLDRTGLFTVNKVLLLTKPCFHG